MGEFPHYINQHVQPSPVGHTDDDFPGTGGATFLYQFIQQGNHAFTTFQGKPFLPYILGMQVFLQGVGRGYPFQYAPFFCSGKRGCGPGFLQPLLDPSLLFRFIDMHVFGADGPAIGRVDEIEDVPQRHFPGGKQ